MNPHRWRLLRARLLGVLMLAVTVGAFAANTVYCLVTDSEPLPASPTEWFLFGIFVVAMVLFGRADPPRSEDGAEADLENEATELGRSIRLQGVPDCWPLLARVPGLAWLLAPRLELEAGQLVLRHRLGRRAFDHGDVVGAEGVRDGVRLELLGGDIVSIPVRKPPSALGAMGDNGVARAVLVASMWALGFNEAVAARILEESRPENTAYRSAARASRGTPRRLRVDSGTPPSDPVTREALAGDPELGVLEPRGQGARFEGGAAGVRGA